MRDFTMKIYKQLLEILKDNGFQFIPFKDYSNPITSRYVILRHDVDAKKENSLESARIEHQLGIKGTYYFRVVPQSYDEGVMKEIASMGHEIGYHYETMDTSNGDIDKAFDEFCRNLEKFRAQFPVVTVCMHGSPLSKHDNRDIWKKFDYHSIGITGEPYFDMDFKKVLYLTDTGRRWDGEKVSVRDKVMNTTFEKQERDLTSLYSFRNTHEIINEIKKGLFPDKVMITVHPQRWNDDYFSWLKEVTLQNLKNPVKRLLIRRKIK
jgi:hypothetical protein